MTNNPVILNLETSTTVCSVTITHGNTIVAEKEINDGYQHAERLHQFIRDGLDSSNISPRDLHAVSLSAGPGSYTGLRIGSSTAKGFCLALDIPLITLGTLQVLAHALVSKYPNSSTFCTMLDAGRMEVYTAVFDRALNTISEVQAMVLDETSVRFFEEWPGTVFGGPGAPKAGHLLSVLPGAVLHGDLVPSARLMTALSLQAFERKDFTQMADFEPFYLKNFIAGKKRRDRFNI